MDKRILIDSDVLIDFFNKQNNAFELIERLHKKDKLFVSAITVSELCAGWDKNKTDFCLPKLYALTRVIPVTKELAEKAGELRYEYKRKGIVLPTVDTLIAAICILNDYFLVTRNIKHYPMPEIKIFKM